MKRTNVLILLFCVFGLHSFSQTKLVFEKTVYDFDTIEQNSSDGSGVFKFKNTGNDTVFIYNVYVPSNNLVVSPISEAILPNKSGEIRFTWGTPRIGKFNTSISIITRENKVINLTVKGYVRPNSNYKNVIIAFEKTEIVDTIYVDSNKTSRIDRQYIFPFKNSGTEILIINNIIGNDGGCVNEFPKYPIKPGQKDSIQITCAGYGWEKLLQTEKREIQMTRHRRINSNALNEETLTIKQFFLIKK